LRRMSRRFACTAAVVASILVPTASAAKEKLVDLSVPTGGFSLAVPGNWKLVTTPVPQLAAAAKDGTLKLFVADPSVNGSVYMNAFAQRLGPVGVKTVASSTAAAIRRSLGKKANVTNTKFPMAAGTAYVIHIQGKSAGTNDSDEFLLIRDQVEYALIYVAEPKLWARYQSLFLASARSFKFLPSPNLSPVVLTGAQVGHGYKLAAFPGGSSFIGEPTLDLCAGSYPSETLRTGRLQVEYTHPKKTVSVSNEVVTYVSGGAKEALAEVTKVARSCATKPVVMKTSGVTVVYKTKPLHDPRLPGALSVKIVEKQSKGRQHLTETGVAVYQVRGNTLSGIYVFVDKGTTFADAERVAFHAAEQSNGNLSKTPSTGASGSGSGSGSKSKGKTGTTGSKGFVA
jgi:hypothetical protein